MGGTGDFVTLPLLVGGSGTFVREVREIRIEPDEELPSYYVSALLTCLPVDKGLKVIGERLEEDQTRRDRTPLAPDDIIRLLSLCLKCTYFLFQVDY